MNLDDIIKGCRRNNAKAQEALYHLYKDALFVLCLKYCRNEAEAEDNLHNAFIDIFTTIKNYKGNGSFEGWVKRITINKAISSFKKNVMLVPVRDDISADTDVGDDEMQLPAETILGMVQELPDQYRLVFSLYELDDYSHKEIAAILQISEGTSKSNLHRAKVLLKEKITAKNNPHNLNTGNGR